MLSEETKNGWDDSLEDHPTVTTGDPITPLDSWDSPRWTWIQSRRPPFGCRQGTMNHSNWAFRCGFFWLFYLFGLASSYVILYSLYLEILLVLIVAYFHSCWWLRESFLGPYSAACFASEEIVPWNKHCTRPQSQCRTQSSTVKSPIPATSTWQGRRFKGLGGSQRLSHCSACVRSRAAQQGRRHGVSCRGAAAASGASEAWAPLVDMPYSGLSGRDFFRIQVLDLSRAGDLLLTW